MLDPAKIKNLVIIVIMVWFVNEINDPN